MRHKTEALSEPFEIAQQMVVGPVTPRLASQRVHFVEDGLLQLEVRVQVDLCCFQRLVAEPDGNQRSINSGLEQLHRCSMAQDVRCHALFRKRGARALSCCDMFSERVLHSIRAEATAVATGEQEARVVTTLLVDPCFQHSHCWFRQRCASLLSSFTFATDVCTRTERHVSLPQPSNLGKPQPCLHSHQQQGVVTPSYPGGFIHTAK